MKQYDEHINSMWEEVEGKKRSKEYRQEMRTEEERWQQFKKEFARKRMIADSEWGVIDCSTNAMEDIVGGEKITYDEYLEIMRVSGHECRKYFAHCYYSAWDCSFKGKIEKKSKSKICFNKIDISGFYGDGTGFSGKEDHIWLDLKGFENYEIGDCISFHAEVYRYLKKGNGKKIDYGLRNPSFIKKTEEYELPTDGQLLLQAIDEIICEVCLFREHCYMGMCIANIEWREEMRAMLLGLGEV